MNYRYICIEREYGSGGTEIGRRLAARCGIPCYGREILDQVAEKLGTTVELIQQYEENSTGSMLYSLVMLGRLQSGSSNFLAGEDYIYLEEQAVIRRLAHNGPAVFLGHCAAKALEDRAGVLRVFIHASPVEKQRRVVQDYRIPPASAEAVMRKFDRKRRNYFNANTKQRWEDLHSYDLVLDSSALGQEGCVELLQRTLSDGICE
ncbi:MAG: cytidylate kinase-like family protein [Eubacteriales bacterium]|nr:cytidylate kinase-like family protein [Eubacteriales bacterium]